MARYIERETLINELEHLHEDNALCYLGVYDCVKTIPTADVAEVRHGEWVYHECVSSYDGAISGYSCSLCSSFVDEEIFESDDFHDEFCGHCGADMRGVEDGR